jgi:hypothetical protein
MATRCTAPFIPEALPLADRVVVMRPELVRFWTPLPMVVFVADFPRAAVPSRLWGVARLTRDKSVPCRPCWKCAKGWCRASANSYM